MTAFPGGRGHSAPDPRKAARGGPQKAARCRGYSTPPRSRRLTALPRPLAAAPCEPLPPAARPPGRPGATGAMRRHPAPATASSPPQHSAQQGGVEALGRREASLHFRHRDLVLGGGAEQREAARHRAEDLVGVHHPAEERVLVDGDGGDGVVVRLGEGHGACREGGAGW